MSDIENELRRLGDNLRNQGSAPGAISPRHRRRIKARRALFAAGGAVTAIIVVATASYGLGLVRDERGIAPAEDAAGVLMRFNRSGGFTGDHHVLTIQRDGSAVLESPGSRGLVEPVEFELEPDVMAAVQDEVRHIDWASLDGERTATDVGVADGYRFEISHDEYKVVTESGAEPRSLRPLIDLLNAIMQERSTDAVADEPSLSLSDTKVRSGDVVDLSIRARTDYIWGVLTSLEAERDGRWRRAAYWETWLGRGPRVLEAITTRGGAVRDIGFSGSADFRLEIPQLRSGTYRITKDFVAPAGTGSVEDRTTTAEVRFEVVADESSTPERGFAAIWPEDDLESAERACEEAAEEDSSVEEGGENIISVRNDPASIALEFGSEVLGWETALLVEVASRDELVYELRRGDSVPDSGRGRAAVRVRPVEVLEGCWSVGSVSRPPADEPQHHGSMVVRDREVLMGFGLGGASSAMFEVGYGGKITRHLWTRGQEEGVEFRLDFEPSGTGHFLVLLRDADGNVFSAFGSPLPEGDFAAG